VTINILLWIYHTIETIYDSLCVLFVGDGVKSVPTYQSITCRTGKECGRKQQKDHIANDETITSMLLIMKNS
jgi:hypothetical protein